MACATPPRSRSAEAMTVSDDLAAEFHPVQVSDIQHHPYLPESVTRRAYEVYVHLYGEQSAMVDLAGRGCRGGFGVGEIIAFLYARSFPKEQWRARADEALRRKP
jgi:hypothetical protein